MAGKADIEAGKAYVALYMKDKGWIKGLDAAGAKLKSVGKGISIFGAAVAGVGASITAPMLAMVHSVTEAGSSMKLMSERTGLSVESLSELRYAAEQSGASIEDVQKALLMAAKKGFDPKKFDEMANSLAAIEDPGKRAESAFKIFGKGAGAILPMLHDLPRLRQEARDLGLVMSDKTATGAHKLHNAWNTLGRVVGGVKGAIGGALIPVIQQYVEWQTKVAISVRDWVRQHKEMFVAAFKVGVVLTGVGTAIATFGGLVAAAGMALIGFNAVLGVIVSAVGFLVSPIGLVLTGLAGLSYWFFTSTKAGKDMVQGLVGWFTMLKDTAVATFGGISDAISAGDLTLAMKVAWAGIKVMWLQGTNSLRETWIGFKNVFMQTTLDVVFKAAEAWTKFVAVVDELFLGLKGRALATMLDLAAEVSKVGQSDAVKSTIDTATNFAQNAIIIKTGDDIANAEKQRNTALQQLNIARQAAKDAVDENTQKQLTAAQAAMAEAEKQLKSARETAATRKKEAENKSDAATKPGDFNLSADKIKGQVFGTFSAAAASMQGSGDASPIAEQRKANRIHQLALKEAQEARAYLKLIQAGLVAKS